MRPPPRRLAREGSDQLTPAWPARAVASTWLREGALQLLVGHRLVPARIAKPGEHLVEGQGGHQTLVGLAEYLHDAQVQLVMGGELEHVQRHAPQRLPRRRGAVG